MHVMSHDSVQIILHHILHTTQLKVAKLMFLELQQ